MPGSDNLPPSDSPVIGGHGHGLSTSDSPLFGGRGYGVSVPDSSSSGDLGHSLRSAVPAVPRAEDLNVEPQNLRAAANTIDQHADELADSVPTDDTFKVWQPADPDTVTKQAVNAWNLLIVDGDDAYINKVRGYIEQLRSLADNLRKSAETYEGNEENARNLIGSTEAGQ